MDSLFVAYSGKTTADEGRQPDNDPGIRTAKSDSGRGEIPRSDAQGKVNGGLWS